MSRIYRIVHENLSRNAKVLDSFPPQKWKVNICSMSGLKIIFFLLLEMMSIMDVFHTGRTNFMSDIFTLPLAKL